MPLIHITSKLTLQPQLPHEEEEGGRASIQVMKLPLSQKKAETWQDLVDDGTLLGVDGRSEFVTYHDLGRGGGNGGRT